MRATFDGDAQSDGGGFTPPGTIDIFDMKEVTFGESEGGKEYFEINLVRKEDSIKSKFFVETENSQKRFKNLYVKATDQESVPANETAIIAALKGKKLAFKVGGQMNKENGKGYSAVGFFNFCAKPALIADLKFSPKEIGEIKEVLLAQEGGSSSATATSPAAVNAAVDNF